MSSILENINSHINEGKFYEASQMYKVLIMRYAKNGKLDTSIQLAIKGIKTMFQSKKVALSSEIAYTLVKDVLEKYEFKMDQVVRFSATLQLTVLQILSDIVKMYNDCGLLENGELESKVRFLKAAVIFSAAKNKSAATDTTENTASDQSTSTKKKKSESASASDQGEPSLHLVLAKTYEQLGDYKKANTQFIRSHDMNEYAKMLIHWSLDSRQALITLQQAPASESDDDEKQQKTLQTLLLNEDDLLLTRSLLQVILGTNSHLEAKQLFDAYLKLFKQEMGADLKKPLIQFDRFLLLAVEKKNYDLLNKSMKSYEQELSRDSKIQDLLKNVTSNVFGIKVADNSMAGMLNSMLGSLMGGGSSSNSGGAAANSNPMAALLGSLGGAAPRPSSNNSPSSIVDDDLD